MEVTTHFTENAQHDYELVQEALTKNSNRAFTKLLNRYKDTIYFMLLKMINNSYEAEELTIEAFGKAFSRLDQYSPEYAFSTWLFRIASNNCIDYLRKKERNPLAFVAQPTTTEDEEELSPLDLLISDNPTPDEHLERKQLSTQLRSMVEKLKPDYREIIELRCYEDLSYDEIADRLSVPVSTVKTKLFRAKEALKNMNVDNLPK